MSKVITGGLHSKNGGCIDWGWHGFVAYGCHSFVVVIHAKSMTAVQTLPGHVGKVIKVRWSRADSLRHATDLHDRYLRLASADSLGRIIVWNVLQAQVRCEFGESNAAAVVDMQWLCCQDTSPDLLLALHGPATLILWNGDQGTQLWRVVYTDVFIGFSMDPFQLSRIAFLNAVGNLLLIEDFSTSTAPSGQTTKQYRLTQANESSTVNMPESVVDFHSKRSAMSLSIKNQLVKALGSSGVSVSIGNNAKINNNSSDNTNSNNNTNSNSSSSSNSSNNNNNSMVEWASMMNSDEVTTSCQQEICCRQLVYQPSRRGHLFLVYSREIVLVNVDRMLPVLHLTFDRSASAILSILPCRQRDAFYMCQENGGLSLRVCRYSGAGATEFGKPVTMSYETVCCLENQQRNLVKSWFPVGICLAPDCELRLAAVTGNGRLCRYDVEPVVDPEPTSPAGSTWYTLSQLASQWNQWAWPTRLTQACVRYSLGGSPTIVRSCPSRGRNGEQLILIGNQDGVVQLVDADRGELERDFGLHSCPVVCLEWVGVEHFVSCACLQNFTASSSTNLVRNELFYVDIRSGRAQVLRPECDESAIEMIKVSHFYSYLAIAFRRQPMEIWDLKSFRLLKKMSRRCPIVVDMAWSTKHHHVQRLNVNNSNSSGGGGGLGVDSKDEMMIELDNDETTVQESPTNHHQQHQSQAGVLYRENLVVLDHENHLWHVVVKGLHVKDGCEVQTQWTGTSGPMSAMAWKEDLLVFGDSDGQFCAWNLQSKTSNCCKSSDLGEIRNVQFCPRPGDFTVLALQAEGASVWNPHKLICLSKLRLDAIGMRVVDLSLLESGVPVLLTTDGCARIYDAGFSTLASNNERQIAGRLFCPTLWSTSSTKLVKYTLLEQVAFDQPPPSVETIVERLGRSSIDEFERSLLGEQLRCLGDPLLSGLDCSSLAGRCRLVAQLLGEPWEVNFWTVVQDALEPLSNETVRLPNCLDYLFPSGQFRRVEWAALSSSLSLGAAGRRQTRNHVATLVLLGQSDAAVELLLAETADPTHADTHYENGLQACLLAADHRHSSAHCRRTIQLVATNWIAAGRLLDGIWLLCLIDKQMDACRYLQSFGYWEQSVWLAKVALDDQRCAEVMLKWTEHLSSSDLTLSLLVLAFLRQWDAVVRMLLDIGQTTVAWLLVQAVQPTPDGGSIEPDSLDRLNRSVEAFRAKYGL
ncbi:WD repeat-containing protein 11 [Trichinella murrelli]|uniref:WD repeat-containing protein 11 n=1 Tax=Trichinella murrelli TaxID=144512 RepID=A0A0V0UCV3_9BILA|nr:WD repeat-containing protein 11 [Trichinella murrelli]